jgi:hypothetical protein
MKVKNWKQFNENNNVDTLFNDVEEAITSIENLMIISQPGVTLEDDLSEILDELINNEEIDSYQIIDGFNLTMNDVDDNNDVVVILGLESVPILEIDELFDYFSGVIIGVAEAIPRQQMKAKFDKVI